MPYQYFVIDDKGITDNFISYHKKLISHITDNFIYLSVNTDIIYMKMISPYSPEFIEFLRTQLGLSTNAIIKEESVLTNNYPLKFDLIIEDCNKKYIVELKKTVRLEALSQIALMKLLLHADNISNCCIEFIIVGKRITSEAIEAAERIGIQFIKLPANVYLEEANNKPGTAPVKLTSPKSWQVISSLLKRNASIRQLSIESKVSYGWTHATVKSLASKGITSDIDGYINIKDINKLLNGIAWERPFERLLTQEIQIVGESTIALAKEICLVCDEQQIPCAFTSFTAGEIYTGYSARHDSVYLYLEKKNISELMGMFDVGNKIGFAVRIYTPDRNVFKDRRMSSIQGIWLVSPAQALLDCAGLGYAGRDLTLKLLDSYDRL